MQDDNWVTVGVFSSRPEAFIAKGLLDSNGIPTEMLNATISSVYPMTDTWTPLELLVPAEFADAAKKLLE